MSTAVYKYCPKCGTKLNGNVCTKCAFTLSEIAPRDEWPCNSNTGAHKRRSEPLSR